MQVATAVEHSPGVMEVREPPIITARNVSKIYRTLNRDDVQALTSTSFDIADGELVSLVGPSGCGKSTLLRMLAGLRGMDLRQIFAVNLRRLGHAKGLSQEYLAYESGVNRTYMSKLEKGGSYVGLEIIGKLAVVLAVEPAEFLKKPAKKPRA